MPAIYAETKRFSYTKNPNYRRILKAPDRPIAIRNEYVTESKVSLILRPLGDAQSQTAYRIEDDDGITMFTVTGRKSSDRSCREFRDASGLPLFELHRKMSFKNVWSVTLPGSSISKIATGTPRLIFNRGGSAYGSFNITFKNVAAMESKPDEEKRLTLNIERHGNALALFDVVDGDRKVAEVRESIAHNKKLALFPESRRGYRPVLDVTVTPGVDLSLVRVSSYALLYYLFKHHRKTNTTPDCHNCRDGVGLGV